MICIKADIPDELNKIDDELKAIYHSKDTVCIWVFQTREDRNKFMDDTVGMKKDDRQNYFDSGAHRFRSASADYYATLNLYA